MYNNLEEINHMLEELAEMEEEIKKDFENMKKAEEKNRILSRCTVLKEKLYLVDKRLDISRDINIMDYVMILELIKEIITYYINDNMNRKLPDNFYRYYDIVLSEVEPALDDLTITSLMLVVKQYQDIEKIRDRSTKFSEYYKIRKGIGERHKEFQKIIKRNSK